MENKPCVLANVAAVHAARASGAISDLNGCKQAVAAGGLPGAIAGCGDCACEFVFDPSQAGPVIGFMDDNFDNDAESWWLRERNRYS